MHNFDQSLQPFTGIQAANFSPTPGSASHPDLSPPFYLNSPRRYAFPPPSGSPFSPYAAHYANFGTPPFHTSMEAMTCGSFTSPQAHLSNASYSNPGYASRVYTPHTLPDFRVDRGSSRFASPLSSVSSRGTRGVTDESSWASNQLDTSSRSSRKSITPARNYWITRALSDPWANIDAVITPSPTCLVSRPLPHRHTILFTPRELRRKAQPDDQLGGAGCCSKRFSYSSPTPIESDAASLNIVEQL